MIISKSIHFFITLKYYAKIFSDFIHRCFLLCFVFIAFLSYYVSVLTVTSPHRALFCRQYF